jgi:hypothetical protein
MPDCVRGRRRNAFGFREVGRILQSRSPEKTCVWPWKTGAVVNGNHFGTIGQILYLKNIEMQEI